jgi:hypothetical protein
MIKLVDAKAIQVKQLKNGKPTASPPSDEHLAQAKDYDKVTEAETPWEGVTPDGKAVKLPCKKVVYVFNHQVVADIWYPDLLSQIDPKRLETQPKAKKPED